MHCRSQFPAVPREPCRRESGSRLVVDAGEPVRGKREPRARVKSARAFRDRRVQAPEASGAGRSSPKRAAIGGNVGRGQICR